MSHLWKRHHEMILAVGSGIFVLLAWSLENLFPKLSLGFYLLTYVVGGYQKAKEASISLIQERKLDVNLLMIVAAIGAGSIGHWLEGAMLIVIFAFSGALESYTMSKSERDLTYLLKLRPQIARVLADDGEEKEVPIEKIKVGEQVLIRPGERVPTDGKVIQGVSYVDQASITGESVPVEKQLGDFVYAGTINGNGSLIVEVTKSAEETVFSKIVHLLEQAKNEVPVTQQFIERIEGKYAITVLCITLTLLVIPPILTDWTWFESFYRAMVFLVVASPCALVASIMPALLSAISHGAKKGILFKNGAHLEQLADMKVIAFDKTGTITSGEFTVIDIVSFCDDQPDQLLKIAGSIETASEHPIAKAIVKEAKERGLTLKRPERLTAIIGVGVEATMNGEIWRIGKASHFEGIDSLIQSKVEEEEQAGKTVVCIGREKKIEGMITLMDRLRPQVREIIGQVKKLGIKTVLLTGDKAVNAQTIAAEAGIDHVYSDLLPEQKVEKIRQLQQTEGKVAMIGDGVNDAPALAIADVGIAMGGVGSEVALESADVVLMKDNLRRVVQAIHLGRRLKRIIKQNLVFAGLVILFLLVANFTQFINLPVGVIGHEGSTLLVIVNGLRLLR